jgi:AcrR family transcriptional regulator
MALAKLSSAPPPSALPDAGPRKGGKQSLKSAQTRARLIEATINCIVKYGYNNSTTPQIAAEANMSRGAMLHHFENGAALMKAAIVELHEKRLRAFKRAASTDHNNVNVMVRTYWRQVQKPTFIAFHELALAARTHPDLARILSPLQTEYRRQFKELAVDLFPEWRGQRQEFDAAMAISQIFLEGMAISLFTGGMDQAMVEPMLQLVEQQISLRKPKPR